MRSELLLTACLPLLALTALPANAAVLTFDGDICGGGNECFHFSIIDQSYGDGANWDVLYDNDVSDGNPLGDASAGLQWWSTGYSDLENVAWGGTNDSTGRARIFLQPSAGYEIELLSLDLGAYSCTTLGSQLTVTGGSGINTAAINIGNGTCDPDSSNSFAFGGYSSTGIDIQWGPSAYNVGIDNVRFNVREIGTTGVPEPGTMALFGGSLLGLTALRRRKKKA